MAGYVLADFTQINFNGWQLKSTVLDSYLIPATRRSKPMQLSEPWTKLDVVMFKGKSILARSREKQLGSLLDIQSFVHAEGSSRGKPTRTPWIEFSVIRFSSDTVGRDANEEHCNREHTLTLDRIYQMRF